MGHDYSPGIRTFVHYFSKQFSIMVSYEDALNMVLDTAPEIGPEHVNFQDSLGRVLYEDVRSDIDLPPFSKSAMDGYACRLDDLDKELNVVEVIPAGKTPSKIIQEGQCAKIMTGAMLPQGADVVIKVEDTETTDHGLVRFKAEKTKSNIVFQAEDLDKGGIVLSKGLVIEPQHIAVLATVGCIKPKVAKQVKVGTLSTGDEIVEPDQYPVDSQIRNSNAYQLAAQVEKMGAKARYYGIAEDDEEKSYQLINKALMNEDVVLLTGGVSMGDFDFIPKVLDRLGFELKFKTVAIQPGKPTVYGMYKDKRIFGLPGNPVSSFITFELFVKPLIYKMAGAGYEAKKITLPMGQDYHRKRSNRLSWLPVIITSDQQAYPLEYHGSAHISSLVDADGIVSIPVGVTKLAKGDLVDVRYI